MSILSQMQTNPLMQMGLGMLSQSGPTPYPTGGAALGRGAMMGMQNLQAGQQAQFQKQQQGMLMEQQQQQMEQERALREYAIQQGMPGEMANSLPAQQLYSMLNQPPQETFSPIYGPNGEILGQESSTTGKVVTDPRTPPTPPTPANIQSKSGILQGEDRVTTFNFDPDTGVYSRLNAQGVLEEFPGSMITPAALMGSGEDLIGATRRDDLIAQWDSLSFQSQELTRLIGIVEEDPSLVGITGMFRRNIQIALGSWKDLSQMFTDSGVESALKVMDETKRIAALDKDITHEQFTSLFNDPALSEISLFENGLAYTLARLRVPDGRLLATVIDDAKKDASLTAYTSSQDVIYRMTAINSQIQRKLYDLGSRIGDGRQGSIPTMEELMEKYL